MVSRALHAAGAMGVGDGVALFPFVLCAFVISAVALWVAIMRFGKKEMR